MQVRDDGVGRVRLLGPVDIEGRGGPEPTSSPIVRTLLALLASRPGRVVSTDLLIDQLWPESSPKDPRKALQVQMSRLRAWLLLGDVDRAALRHEHAGYVLAIEPDTVDLVRFAHAAQATVRAEGPDEVVLQAERALAEWRGEPFGGCVDCPDLAVERAHHRELHLATIERRAEALLELGRAEDAVVALAGPRYRSMVQERLTELLMVALFRMGRQQEALAAYEETRRFLVDEFGIGPGDALVRTEAMVLGQDPALLGAPLPASLPTLPDRPHMVGRRSELAVVVERLADRERGALVVVTGEAGAGKTTLAAAAANDAATHGAVVGIGAFDDDAPLAGWRDALTAIGADPEALADDQRTLAVWAALGNAARATPVLVVLEDAHGADTASLRLVQGLVRRGLPAGVVVLATARVPDARETPQVGWSTTVADVARSASTVVLPIGALTRDEADALVADRLTHLDHGAVATVAAELWARSAGHPLHLASLLDVMAGSTTEEECLAAARQVPGALQPLLDHQLRSLPEASREIVEALAITGPVPIDAAAAVVDMAPLAALRALRPAHERGVVVDGAGLLQLRHALWTDVVVAAMGPAVAEELHRRRLGHLVAVDGDPFEVLRHAIGAGSRIDPVTRSVHQAAAGRAAFARGAYTEAAGHLADAGREAEGDVALQIELGLALSACGEGRLAEADEVLDTVVFRSQATIDQVVTAAIGHELLGFRVVGDPRRLARLEEALRLSKDVAAPTRIEVIRALLIEESLVPDRPASTAAADELGALVADVGDQLDPALQARLAAMRARSVVEEPILATERLALARQAHETALAADRPGLVLDALELLVSATLAAGRPSEEVEDVRWVLEQTAELANRPRSRWTASLLPAAVALAEGDGERADALAEAAVTRGSEMGIPDASGAFGVHLVTSHFLRGRLGDLVSLIDGVTAQYPSIPAWPAAGALARAQTGDGPGAREHLRLFLDRRAEQVGLYFDRPALSMAALAAYIAGDHPVCREAAQVVVDGLPPDDDAVIVVGVGAAAMGPVELYRALALAVLGAGPDALQRAEVARSIAARLRWAPWVEGAEALIAEVAASASARTPPPVPGPLPTPFDSPLGLRRLH